MPNLCELLAIQKRRERPRDEIAHAERILAYVTEFRDTAERIRTVAHGGLYGRTAIDRMATNVASARYRESRRPAE